ncbi:MAG TPA: PAS domain-containing protein [Campylobacterales bacterium]|nr:PAS domain-containing protein [Campylobacterales bacterium]
MLNTKLDSALLMDILERQSNPIVRVDCKNRLLYINKSSANLFELGGEYKIGESFLSYMKKEGAIAFENALLNVKNRKLPLKITQRTHTKNELVWIEWEIMPIFDEDGEVKEILLVGQNVSSFVATQDTLNLVFQALEQTSSAVAITDRNGVIVFINQKFEKLYGYTKEEAIGKTPRILKSELTDPKIFKEIWQKIIGGGYLTAK